MVFKTINFSIYNQNTFFSPNITATFQSYETPQMTPSSCHKLEERQPVTRRLYGNWWELNSLESTPWNRSFKQQQSITSLRPLRPSLSQALLRAEVECPITFSESLWFIPLINPVFCTKTTKKHVAHVTNTNEWCGSPLVAFQWIGLQSLGPRDI